MKRYSWQNYRNRNCWLNGKKLKLRKYIHVSAALMKHKNKAGWQKVDHVSNYKNALAKYGFCGLKIYEDYFYKGIPLPENRTWLVRLGLKVAPLYVKIINLKNKLKWKNN